VTIVKTVAGQVRGADIGDRILAWTGIPYDAPPVGPLRLRLPRPAEPWNGVRDGLRRARRAAARSTPGGGPLPPASTQLHGQPTTGSCATGHATISATALTSFATSPPAPG
jgi:hypothetical protein